MADRLSEELLSRISGGVLDEMTKQEIRDAVDYFKASGVTLDFFISHIINEFADHDEAEAYIRNYWENGII